MASSVNTYQKDFKEPSGVISPRLHHHKTPDITHRKDPINVDHQMRNTIDKRFYSKDTGDV